MSAVFGNLKTDGLEESQDRLGGGAPALETDIYLLTIKAAFAGASSGGAQNVTLITTTEGGREYKETIYITNRNGDNWFVNKDDKTKKVRLPGFIIIDDICMLTTEKPLNQQEAEEKVVNVYDFDAKKEMPKNVPMLMALLGKTFYAAITNTLENQSDKVGSGADTEYVPNAKTRNTNAITKVFHDPSKVTMVEARNGQEAAFFDSWLERNKGQTIDKRTIKDGEGGNSGRPGGQKSPPAAGGSGGTERKSLFGNK